MKGLSAYSVVNCCNSAVLDGTTTQVDDQTMGMEEICPDDGLLHVSHDKNPCECAPQVQTDRERPSTVRSNVTAIGSSEVVLRCTTAILAVSRKNTNSGTRVD